MVLHPARCGARDCRKGGSVACQTKSALLRSHALSLQQKINVQGYWFVVIIVHQSPWYGAHVNMIMKTNVNMNMNVNMNTLANVNCMVTLGFRSL